MTAAVLAVSFSIAQADVKVGEQRNGFSVADEQYLRAYEQAHRAGFDVGRNLLDSAWSDAEPVSDERIAASTATLSRWLNPPEPEPVETVSYSEPTYEEPTAAPSYAPSGDLSSIAACESGGDPGAVDPSGTYMGAFQFDQATWEAAGGSGTPLDASYEEQAAIAAGWIAAGHRSAWPNC